MTNIFNLRKETAAFLDRGSDTDILLDRKQVCRVERTYY